MPTYLINIWINEERYQDELLRYYPNAKFDNSTTKSIELFPSKLKRKMFEKAYSLHPF